ncbi:MAG: hypothetical protein QM765_24130 [Myxococcales bacterium]
MTLSILAAILFLQAPESAPAVAPAGYPAPQPACAVGQIIVDDAGHCCWPGQSWKRNNCHGKPHCPPGLAATRNTCVPAAAPATYPAYPAVPGQAPSPTFAGVPTQPVGVPVPVRFTAAKPDDSYEVEVLTSGMPVCKTPCELQLVPDRYKVRVRGSGHFSEKLRVLDQPMDLKIEHASGGWKVLGTVSIAVGSAAFVVGLAGSAAVFLTAQTDRNDTRYPYPADPNWARKRNEKLAITGSISFAGLVVAVVGGVVGLKNAGRNDISPIRRPSAPGPAPSEVAPDTDNAPAPAPAAEPEKTSERDEPALQLVGIGAAPTENGMQFGAMFTF